MVENIISYKQAQELKELKFNSRTTHYYENGKLKLYTQSYFGWDFNNSFLTCCSAPTFEQVFDWLKEVHGLDGDIHLVQFLKNDVEFKIEAKDREYSYKIIDQGITQFVSMDKIFKSITSAKKNCLDELIEMLKNK